jgi:hypothetical protein
MVELLGADRHKLLSLALALLLDGINFLDSLLVVHVERLDGVLSLLQWRHLLGPEEEHLELAFTDLANRALEQGVTV